MHIVKLSATDSTNSYLKNLMLSQPLQDYTVVVTEKQLKGRGQMGAIWTSESGKNLTFSILKKFKALSVIDRFLLTIAVSKAIYTVLGKLKVPDVSIKWPNDILSGQLKICGILLENTMAGNDIKSSIIGIGLNVNQIDFGDVVNATSMHIQTGSTFDLQALLQTIVDEVKHQFKNIENKILADAIVEYESLLFRKDIVSTFQDQKGEMFMGIIRGVTIEGKLKVELEDNILQEFALKEVKLVY
ncbi:biotin--[acetyl-CoA-carboxylase] ligase [Costertonia aggregata]|uniref:Biotin--[acetyl-CoA-carboxylase] ligase n=1 Tax=Costertonia aggregata TaxID=343403 RepID=A0A7H9ALF8_9FLAO|nr:biotin--[acetyl-CoA-carboxylase] ligase [Costertonia aggregata]QLG44279.1 biotin--[acetyl-CoA-carboxylase] ligase [Costertonia aggregata]